MNLRVLIVDDEPPARERLRSMLVESGEYDVAGEAGDLRSWTLRDDRSAFDEQTVEVSEPSPFNLQP